MDRAGTLATNGMATGLGADLNGGTVVSDSSTTSRGAIDSGGASDSIRAVLMVKPTTAREQARDLGRDGEPTSGRAGTVVAAAASAASHPHTGYTEFSNHLSLNTHVLPQLQTTDLGDILSSLGPLPPTGLASTDPAPDFQPVLDVDKPVEVFSYFYTKLDSLPLGPPVTSRTPSATSKSDQSGLRSDQMSFLESGPTSIAQSPFTSPPHSRNGSISLQSTRLSATEAATAARVVGHGSGKLGTLPASPLGPSQTGFVPPPAVVAAPPSLFAREPMWNTPSQTPSSQLDGGVSTPGSLVLSRMETDTAVSNGKGFALLARSDASVSIDSRGSIGTPSTSSMAFGSPSLAPAVLGAAPTLSSAASVTALPDRDRYGFRHPQFPPAAHRVALDRHYKGVLTRRRARWDALIASEPRRWSRSRSMRRKSGDQITSHPEPVTSAGPWSEDAEGRIDWGTGWWMPYRRRKYLDRPADSTGVVTNTQLTKREWEWDDGGDTGERIKRYVRKGIPPEVRGRSGLARVLRSIIVISAYYGSLRASPLFTRRTTV
ncbi:hypothetical protein M427DRAFT_377752 [Gonapodya prolifera JEL478]|uniref:Uncharacterized protein n=1 Tax=Gonapodya prolifera (strain JEL478) TaxID=1344416 RepID=A0A139AV12_GONPJ|nr:hypothetical protein M427DRAFT_377752 [Gonapodya prolifera JEL478]|eukprot:KXS20539.1 hypothetical protein M427DRAFT_377752 [Gonapodya prolifera JEL478]